MAFSQAAPSQEKDAYAVTSPQPFYREYGGFAFKIGSAITAFLAILKGVSEWTAPGRKNKAMEKVVRLARFVDAAGKLSAEGSLTPQVLEVKTKALSELRDTTARCYPPEIAPSKIRQMLLLYLPPRWMAYIPHFFFFSFLAMAGAWLYAASTDDSGDIGPGGFVGMLVVIGAFVVLMQRWAALEWRNKSGTILQSKSIWLGLHCNPSNSFLGLVSNSFLVVSALALFLLPVFDAITPSPSSSWADLWPIWQRVISVVIGSPSVLIAYFWSRSEFLLSTGSIESLTLRDIAVRTRDLRYPERQVGFVVFLLLTIWCLVLIGNVRYVPALAAIPDGSVGTIGPVGAWAAVCTMFFLNGAVPWVAVYRGLPMLFAYPSKLKGGEIGPDRSENE